MDGSKYVARRPNPAAWTFDRTGGGLDAAPTNLQAIIACGDSSWAELRLALDVDSGPVLASPPTASIRMPTSVTCGDSVDLRGTFGDPDGDLDTVRWEVDGVRISDSVSEVRISETHEVRAIAVDARGATTTAEHTIGCN